MVGAPAQGSGQGQSWVERPPSDVPRGMAASVGGHHLVAATLARLGISTPALAAAFLDPARYRPAPATDLPDLERAAERITRAAAGGETILVWGDFDADGQTSTTVLVSAIRDVGGQVWYHIPDRSDGHGISLPRLTGFLAEGIDLIVTCDTGIGELEAITVAQEGGVDVIVTDHHDLTAGIPPAFAAVNPKRLAPGHPLRELPGVGVAYKLAEALYDLAGRGKDVAALLDLVAIGIVADVALLSADTRYLLQLGLERLRNTPRLGLIALMETARVAPAGLTEEHIGFFIAPRLNAMGRMANAQVAVEFLTTTDPLRARILASEIEGLNTRRKLASDQVMAGAEAQIERDPSLLDDSVLVLSNPAWPAGVIGIVAGHLARKYNRPAVLVATPPGQAAHGSCRSVAGCSIVDALAANSDLLNGFGGHPMAAGLSLDAERLPELRRALDRTVREQCGGPMVSPPLQVDAFVPLSEVTLDLAAELNRLAPFGAGHPALVLATRDLSLASQRRVGRNGAHLQLSVEDQTSETRRVMWWGGADSTLPEGRFDLAYTVRANDYRGSRRVQLEWIDARQLAAEQHVLTRPAPALQVVDHRQAADLRALLRGLRLERDVQVWAEAGHRAQVEGSDRCQLEPRAGLAIWTVPPGPRELRAAIERANPEAVYLFGVDPGLGKTAVFLRRLAGLVKRILTSAQDEPPRTTFGWLAAATAQREATVRAGLLWLVTRGIIEADTDGDQITLSPGTGRPARDLGEIEAAVSALLAETAAYRAFFGRADADTLLKPRPDRLPL